MRHVLARAFLAWPLPAALALTLLPSPAGAQLVLPGAVAPTPEGATAPAEPSGAAPARRSRTAPARPKPRRTPPPDRAASPAAPAAPAKILSAASLAGQTLYHGGRGSEISFALRDNALVVSRLSLVGRGDDGSECRIDIADLPLAVRDEGQPSGMARIGIPVPACPISLDVLDGAALETGGHAVCSFTATRCSVDPTGLWGPPATALTPERDKVLDRERARADSAIRTSFKRLVSTTRDRPTIMGYARDQAQFSSTREEMCRGYAGELKHGFCSTRLTEARATALRTEADIGQAEKDRRKRARKGR